MIFSAAERKKAKDKKMVRGEQASTRLEYQWGEKKGASDSPGTRSCLYPGNAVFQIAESMVYLCVRACVHESAGVQLCSKDSREFLHGMQQQQQNNMFILQDG